MSSLAYSDTSAFVRQICTCQIMSLNTPIGVFYGHTLGTVSYIRECNVDSFIHLVGFVSRICFHPPTLKRNTVSAPGK
ncbi:hypothetical protein DYBT9623_04498 [Dyadobacter sp. CECT 9623]|uniref:Uncharacterized protein n=1 Tax=Dyadobacter linearis TaxID=2823330 RepID=A0ABN7RCL5_9BACT|nr:hypothetical protein DYBT9623_04498 [Dyadobacter sp. CECT 9623]